VFFQGDTLARFEGDEMPSETEFVATLGSRKGKPKVPSLEATKPSWPATPPQGRGGQGTRSASALGAHARPLPAPGIVLTLSCGAHTPPMMVG
jgi:outer membrane protein assembly factor BamE